MKRGLCPGCNCWWAGWRSPLCPPSSWKRGGGVHGGGGHGGEGGGSCWNWEVGGEQELLLLRRATVTENAHLSRGGWQSCCSGRQADNTRQAHGACIHGLPNGNPCWLCKAPGCFCLFAPPSSGEGTTHTAVLPDSRRPPQHPPLSPEPPSAPFRLCCYHHSPQKTPATTALELWLVPMVAHGKGSGDGAGMPVLHPFAARAVLRHVGMALP